ncbi:MAG: hypothetical protein HKM02_01675 [Pseudomonadales bacterium]|nr:hypothetical protein [Pseudomonadales bacterium]
MMQQPLLRQGFHARGRRLAFMHVSLSVSSLSAQERLYVALLRIHLQPTQLLFVELTAWELLSSSPMLKTLWVDLRSHCRVVVLCPPTATLPVELSLAQEVHLELCRG